VSISGTRAPALDNGWLEIPFFILSAGKTVIRHNQEIKVIKEAARLNNAIAKESLLILSDVKSLLLKGDLEAATIGWYRYTPPIFKAVRGSGMFKPFWNIVDE
jgi:hypothetical protein